MFPQLWVPSFYFLDQLFADLVELDVSSPFTGILEAVFMGLWVAPTPAPTPGLLMAGITEATYTGYARQAVVWFPRGIDALGRETMRAHNLNFTPSDSVTPNTITGVFLTDNATVGMGHLLLSAQLATPVALNGASQSLNAKAVFQLPFTPIYGGVDVES